MRRVAITGFGVVSPMGNGKERFWRALSEGKSGIRPIRHFDASAFQVQLAGEIKESIALSDRAQELSKEDPKVGFAYAACVEALAQAGLTKLDENSLLHIGTSLEVFDLEKVIHNGRADFKRTVLESLSGSGRPLQIPLDTAARLIEDRFGRAGRSLTNCSACAAGTQTLGQAFRAIQAGEFEVAVCGGFDSMINPLGIGGFQMLGALTTDNDRGESACRPFDASRTGTVLGEGAALFVLEPVEKAQAEGKTILAEICGYGSTLDAHSLSAPDPQGDGAIRAMQAALKDARLTPGDIQQINAHGTGTLLNDEIEAKAIRHVFEGFWERIPVCATKSLTGHLIAAAGAVEVGALLFTFMRNVLPHHPFLNAVGLGCELDHVTKPGILFTGEYVLKNSFGFGGQNATLILRRYNGR